MIDNQVNLEKRSSERFYNYLGESAIFIAIVTGSLYFIGYMYYNSFFKRLTVPSKFLNIQAIDYMTAALIPILALSIFYIVILKVWSHAPRNRIEAFLGNLAMIIPSILIIITYYYIVFGGNYYVNSITVEILSAIVVVVAVVTFLYYIYKSYKKVSIAYILYSGRISTKVLYLVTLIGILGMFAYNLGTHDAKELIQGKSGTPEIQLFLKDNNSEQFQNKTLIFVMIKDNKYYVVEKNETVPKDPKLYIIQDNQIEMAIIHKVN